MNRYGVSSFIPPSPVAKRRHVGGQNFGVGDIGEQCFDKPHTCSYCGYEGLARHYSSHFFEFWTCPECGEKTTVWDENDTLRDGGELPEPHEDPDWLDGPPEQFGPREVA